MATIGSFTARKDGYTGTIRTLTVNVKARIVANDQKKSDGGGPPLRGRARRVDRRPGRQRVSVKVAAVISRRHGVADGAGGRVGLRAAFT